MWAFFQCNLSCTSLQGVFTLDFKHVVGHFQEKQRCNTCAAFVGHFQEKQRCNTCAAPSAYSHLFTACCWPFSRITVIHVLRLRRTHIRFQHVVGHFQESL